MPLLNEEESRILPRAASVQSLEREEETLPFRRARLKRAARRDVIQERMTLPTRPVLRRLLGARNRPIITRPWPVTLVKPVIGSLILI